MRVDRFADRIVRRFPEMARRYGVQPMELDTESESGELVLVSASGRASESRGRRTASASDQGKSPSLAEIKQMLQERGRPIPPSGFPMPASTSVQRETLSDRSVSPSRPLAGRPRPRSRVEEVTPGGKGVVVEPPVAALQVTAPVEPSGESTARLPTAQPLTALPLDEPEQVQRRAEAILPAVPEVVAPIERPGGAVSAVPSENVQRLARVELSDEAAPSLPLSAPSVAPREIQRREAVPPVVLGRTPTVPEPAVSVERHEQPDESAAQPPSAAPPPAAQPSVVTGNVTGKVQRRIETVTPAASEPALLVEPREQPGEATPSLPSAGPPMLPGETRRQTESVPPATAISPVEQRVRPDQVTPSLPLAVPSVTPIEVQRQTEAVFPAERREQPDESAAQPRSAALTVAPTGEVRRQTEAVSSAAAPETVMPIEPERPGKVTPAPPALPPAVRGEIQRQVEAIAPAESPKQPAEATPSLPLVEPSVASETVASVELERPEEVTPVGRSEETTSLPLVTPSVAPDEIQRRIETALPAASEPATPTARRGQSEEATSALPALPLVAPPVILSAVQRRTETVSPAAPETAASVEQPEQHGEAVPSLPLALPSVPPDAVAWGAAQSQAEAISSIVTEPPLPTEPERSGKVTPALPLAVPPVTPGEAQRPGKAMPASPLVVAPSVEPGTVQRRAETVSSIASGPAAAVEPAEVPVEATPSAGPPGIIRPERKEIEPFAPGVLPLAVTAVPEISAPGESAALPEVAPTALPGEIARSKIEPIGTAQPRETGVGRVEPLDSQEPGEPGKSGELEGFEGLRGPYRDRASVPELPAEVRTSAMPPGSIVQAKREAIEPQLTQDEQLPVTPPLAETAGHMLQTRLVERTTVLPLTQIQRQVERRQQAWSAALPPSDGQSRRLPDVDLPVAVWMEGPSIAPGAQAGVEVTEEREMGERLPLPPVSAPPFAGVIQRQTEDASAYLATPSGAAEAIQRAGGASLEMGAAPDESAVSDLDRLAQEVYPRIKRMLAVERERRTGRWR